MIAITMIMAINGAPDTGSVEEVSVITFPSTFGSVLLYV